MKDSINGLVISFDNTGLKEQEYIFGDPVKLVTSIAGPFAFPSVPYGYGPTVATFICSPILFSKMNVISRKRGSPAPMPFVRFLRAAIDRNLIEEVVPMNSALRNTQFQQSFVTASKNVGYWELGPQNALIVRVPADTLVTITLYDFSGNDLCF